VGCAFLRWVWGLCKTRRAEKGGGDDGMGMAGTLAGVLDDVIDLGMNLEF
jgi:hypothetical protein